MRLKRFPGIADTNSGFGSPLRKSEAKLKQHAISRKTGAGVLAITATTFALGLFASPAMAVDINLGGTGSVKVAEPGSSTVDVKLPGVSVGGNTDVDLGDVAHVSLGGGKTASTNDNTNDNNNHENNNTNNNNNNNNNNNSNNNNNGNGSNGKDGKDGKDGTNGKDTGGSISLGGSNGNDTLGTSKKSSSKTVVVRTVTKGGGYSTSGASGRDTLGGKAATHAVTKKGAKASTGNSGAADTSGTTYVNGQLVSAGHSTSFWLLLLLAALLIGGALTAIGFRLFGLRRQDRVLRRRMAAMGAELDRDQPRDDRKREQELTSAW
jgi:hypothetical protein